jgi:hypothetical protein
VPLHRDAEAVAGLFHRFDDAVGRGGRDFESVGDALNRLVVPAVGIACCSAPGTWLGMSWINVPPIATLSSCMPRQIAK